MRKSIRAVMLSCLLLSAVAFAETRKTGWGKELTATVTTQFINDSALMGNSLSVVNNGAVDVFCLVNISATSFDARYTAGSTIKVPAGRSYTFNTQTKDEITSICLRTGSGTAAVLLAAY